MPNQFPSIVVLRRCFTTSLTIWFWTFPVREHKGVGRLSRIGNDLADHVLVWFISARFQSTWVRKLAIWTMFAIETFKHEERTWFAVVELLQLVVDQRRTGAWFGAA